jgi:hypothetical protein
MRFLFALVAVSIIGCSSQSGQSKGKAMNLEQAAGRLGWLSGRSVRPYATRDFGRDQNTDARSVVVAEDQAPLLLANVRSEIGPGLIAFIGCTRSLAEPSDIGSEVVVAPGNSQFDILRVAQSDAVNYDMGTEDLIRKLEQYHSQYGIEIFHAETDTIEFRFLTMPSDLAAFCGDLYRFCPDIVDQGTGSVHALEKEIAKTGTVFLWWD